MPKKKLTDDFIEEVTNSKSYSVDYFDTKTSGLILRVTPKNTKSFCLIYRQNGKQKRMTFAQYPIIDLEEARSKVYQAKFDISKGRDPKMWDTIDKHENIKLQRKEEKVVKKSLGLTVNDLADLFIERYLPQLRQSTQTSYEGYIDRNIRPTLGNEPISILTKKDLLEVLDDIAYKDGHRSTANKVRNLLSKMFNFGIDRDLVESNPVNNIPKYKPTNGSGGRSRFYSEKEIKKIWEAIEGLTYEATKVFFKILFLTGQRRTETLKMKWEDIDFENRVWYIPASDTKNAVPNNVPLSDFAIRLIKSLEDYSGGSKYVFESPQSKHKGTHISSTNSAVKSIKDSSDIDDFRIHDIRRTVATYLTKLGASREVLGKILNHKSLSGDDSVTAVYDRHGYENEKRKALQVWSNRLMEII